MPAARLRPANLPLVVVVVAAGVATVTGAFGAWQAFAAATGLTLGGLALLVERNRRAVDRNRRAVERVHRTATHTEQVTRRQGPTLTAIDKRTGSIERGVGKLRRAGDRQQRRFDQIDHGIDVLRTTVIRRADRTDTRIADMSPEQQRKGSAEQP